MVKASEFKNVCKAVNDRKLAELKKEIIEILKKQDEKDVKKAIDYFNSQEGHYTHLEKSLISGKWIQKAGYGVGTVRIWKGKKYKKIAPGKWARVFDKEGRGTNIAIGKLIARVQKIDNVEDLMAFVMQNKQRFVDENGIDLPVLDKLRAAVDAKNNGDMGSKTTSKPAEKKIKTQEDYEKEYEQSLKGKNDAETLDNIVEAYDKVAKKLRPEAKAKGMNPNELNDPELEALGKLRLIYSEKNISEGEKKYREELEKLSGRMKDAINNEFGYEEESEDEKKTETKEVPFGGVDKNDEGEGVKYLEMADKINEVARKGELKVGDAIFKVDKEGKEWAVRSEIANAIRCKEGIDKINTEFEKTAKPKLEAELKEKLDKIKEKLPEIIKEGKLEENKKLVDERLKRYSEYADEGTTVNEVISKYKNKLINKLEKHVKDNALFTSKDETDIELLSDIDHQVELCSNHLSAAFYTECKKLLEESEAEKTIEETKETPKEEKTEKIYSVDNSGKVVSFDELQPIASNKSVGENEVQLPYSKDLANEIESLKNCVAPKWDSREFMKHVYYENGKLITTDARRMKFIEVGELEGIPNGSYVDINTDKSGINIKKIDVDARFPNYSKVIPEDLKQTATLDTKLVKDKIKEMQKDGAIDKKGTNLVQLEFRDGKVFIDDTPVGEAKDIKMKYSEDWGPAKEDTNYMNINADYLVNALSGKTSILQIGERADKAIEINTGSSSSILMPMSGSDKKMDYGKGRQAKKDANEKKSALKEAYKKTNEEFVASIKEHYGDRFKRLSDSAAANLTERMADMSDETLKLNYDRLKFNLDKVMDKKEYITEDTKVDNKLKLGLRDAILYQTTAKEHPEVIERFEEELEKRGITVKKSLFDDFIVDMFVEEDEEEEPEEENESLFNDYSAEQPELFNSTEMMVSEAFNRCNCL